MTEDAILGPVKTPIHLWIVGAIATIWNAFGCYDYFMTRTQGAAYIKSMLPTADADAMMAYINGFPIWAAAGWGLGVWCGLAGSILLVLRNRFAVPAFALSLLGAVVGLGYQITHPADIAEMHEGANGVMPYVIILFALGLFIYARAMRTRTVLR
nr:hypothetical protein [uncultured Sphingomonas sp.]